MKIYHSLKEYKPQPEGASVALGFFDGVHLGHRAVIGECVADSEKRNGVVLTFRESPAKSLKKPSVPLLTDNERKARLIAALGARALIFADFAAVQSMSPADFVTEILRDRLNAKKVCCGYNYRFGHRGAGDIAALKQLCEAQGITVIVKEPVYCGGDPVSSSLIRQHIAAGEIARANELLGYRFAVLGDITDGNHVGTKMGFPTVNLPIGEDLAVPRYGVYASEMIIDGVRYKGATNIGVHPTVSTAERPLCETFLLDFGGGDLYGKRAECELTAFIRPEMTFHSMEALSAQIKKDCEKIYTII